MLAGECILCAEEQDRQQKGKINPEIIPYNNQQMFAPKRMIRVKAVKQIISGKSENTGKTKRDK